MLDPGDSADWDRNVASIRTAVSASDAVVVYQHFQTDAEIGWQESWARATIEGILARLIDLSTPYRTVIELGDGRATLRLGDQE